MKKSCATAVHFMEQNKFCFYQIFFFFQCLEEAGQTVCLCNCPLCNLLAPTPGDTDTPEGTLYDGLVLIIPILSIPDILLKYLLLELLYRSVLNIEFKIYALLPFRSDK